MAKQIWTQDMRKVMDARLHMEFGPHRSWSGARSPTDNRGRFEAVLREPARYFSELVGEEITPDAVKNQIDWGITVQKEMKDQSHARNYILNKAAALEVGFISSSDLPAYMSVRQAAEA
jgi:hypothetical protein